MTDKKALFKVELINTCATPEFAFYEMQRQLQKHLSVKKVTRIGGGS